MKNFCISFIIVAIIILSVIGLNLPENAVHEEYLRIHIRADSNDTVAQAVKYQVKDAVVDYLTPFIAECQNKKQAEDMLNDNLSKIEKVADQVLERAGFDYKSTAKLKEEQFPTRVYGGLELESGIYDALIIELGSGRGDNWWCVVYPPLCFVGEESGYQYRSKIKELIDRFYSNKEKQAI